MRMRSTISFSIRLRLVFVAVLLCVASHREPNAAAEPAAQKANPAKPAAADIAIGREIFLREWLPNDPRSHGGDGLGPVFNDTSCVACHNLGGAGGGGPASKNVDIVTAAPADPDDLTDAMDAVEPSRDFLKPTLRIVNGIRRLVGSPQIPVAVPSKPQPRMNVDELAKLHPGFHQRRSLVLPRFGTEPEFEKWHPASLIAINALAVPQPVQTVEVPARVDPPSEFGAVPQPPSATAPARVVESRTFFLGRPAIVSRAVISEQPVDAAQAPFEVWRQGDEAVSLWTVGESLLQTASWLVDFVAMPFDPDSNLGSDFGLAPEAVVVQSMRGLGGRSDMLTMSFVNDSTPFGAAMKKANAQLIASRRNPTALFGAGLIDSIPDATIEATAALKHYDFPSVRGRVSRLRDGRIGKFGWKGQTASLRDFTLTACAVELGLNVPGHEQAVVPYKPEYRAPGLDLTENECDALVAYLASLPSPSRTRPANEKYAAYLGAGEKLFAESGCAACHMQKLGDVDGIYSDLLLHDMGPALADSGNYGSNPAESRRGRRRPRGRTGGRDCCQC